MVSGTISVDLWELIVYKNFLSGFKTCIHKFIKKEEP